MSSKKLDYLEHVEIFKDLTSAEVEEVGHKTRMVAHSSGYLFYMPDDPGEVLFVLKEGRVQLYRMSPDGRKFVVAILNPGAIFGQMALIGQRLHQTFAEALDECVLCVMDRHEVERLLLEKPDVALRFLDSMGRRLTELEERLGDTAFKRIPARLAGLLLRLNDETDEDNIVKGYTHQYLADMLGTYRETTTQTLNDFQNRNLIRLGRKHIEILDEVGLNEVATV